MQRAPLSRDSQAMALGTPAQVVLALTEIHLHWLPWVPGQGREPLQRTLAAYVGVESEQVLIRRDDPDSKPYLGGPDTDIRFNWSHTGSHSVLAIARGLELGVDLELKARPVRALPLARRFFASAEISLLEACEPARRAPLFLRLWTGKEAVLKCMGVGLSWGLDRVSIGVDAADLLLRDPERVTADGVPWHLRALATPDADLLAALAWQGDPRRVLHFVQGRPASLASLFAPPLFP